MARSGVGSVSRIVLVLVGYSVLGFSRVVACTGDAEGETY